MSPEDGHVGPRVTPGWWDFTRQFVIFVLGCSVIIYAVVTAGYDVPFLVTGAVLIGIVPMDRYVVTRANGVVQQPAAPAPVAGPPDTPDGPYPESHDAR